MKIIKLDATASTNTFLKDLAQESALDDFTVVVTKKQHSGRGQMTSTWISEDYKNLTFSVFCMFSDLKIEQQRYLNFAVSVSIFELLSDLHLPKLAIKWPNDILSEKHKICGILIENTLQQNIIKSSIIGIGLNVNQEEFPKDIGKTTSIKNTLKKDFNLDELLESLILKLKNNIDLLRNKQFSIIENSYLSALYQKNIPNMFLSDEQLFMGKIIGVSKEGKLQIELEDESVKEFGIKEIKFAK